MTWHLAELISSELGISGSVTTTARLRLVEVFRVGMWKDLYCFALRIDMVLPDWRGFIGLGPHPLVASVPIDLKLAVQPHILKGTCTKPHHPIDCQFLQLHRSGLIVGSCCTVDHLCMVAVC